MPYIISQCVGAISASAVLVWLLGPVGDFGATVPALPVARSFVVEAGYSAILAFVIMGVATDKRSPGAVAPFAIGATVFAGALVTGPLTGGSFNPARSVGPAVIGGIWTGHWLYWLAPVVGIVGAMHLYEALRGASAPASPRDVATGVEGPIGLSWTSPSVLKCGCHSHGCRGTSRVSSDFAWRPVVAELEVRSIPRASSGILVKRRLRDEPFDCDGERAFSQGRSACERSTALAMNSANGTMSSWTWARSSAAKYRTRSSARIVVHGRPAAPRR